MEETLKALQAFYKTHLKIIDDDNCWPDGEEYPKFTKEIWAEYTLAMDECSRLLMKYDKL